MIVLIVIAILLLMLGLATPAATATGSNATLRWFLFVIGAVVILYALFLGPGHLIITG